MVILKLQISQVKRATVDVFCLSEVSLSEAQTTNTPITHEDHLISVYILEPVSRLPKCLRERANNWVTDR